MPDVAERVELYREPRRAARSSRSSRCADRARKPRGARPPRRGGHPPDEPLHDLRAVPAVQHLDPRALGPQAAEHGVRDRQVDHRPPAATNVGELMLGYGGGGHEAAGTCQVDNEDAARVLGELVAAHQRRRLERFRVGSGAVKAPDAHLHRADPVMARLIDDFGGPLPDGARRPRPAAGAVRRARAVHRRPAAVRQGRAGDLARLLDALRRAHAHAGADPRRRPGGAARRGRVLPRRSRYLRSLAEHVVCGRARDRPARASSPTTR